MSREWREYERTNTTVLAAYVHPIAEAYIERLQASLEQGGFGRSPYMMQSNGGITTAEAAKRNPIAMVTLFLVLGTEFQQGRADQRQPHAAEGHASADAPEFLDQDHVLVVVETTTPVLGRPRRRRPAPLDQPFAPQALIVAVSATAGACAGGQYSSNQSRVSARKSSRADMALPLALGQSTSISDARAKLNKASAKPTVEGWRARRHRP